MRRPARAERRAPPRPGIEEPGSDAPRGRTASNPDSTSPWARIQIVAHIEYGDTTEPTPSLTYMLGRSTTHRMNRTLKWTLIGGFAVAIAAVVAISATRRPFSDGRTPEEHRRIADACLSLLRSPLTNDVDIKTDDPRLPEVIRALQPLHIEMMPPSDVVIMRSTAPSEYHLSRRPSEPKTWVLYCAGSGSGHSHRELLRFTND